MSEFKWIDDAFRVLKKQKFKMIIHDQYTLCP